MVVISIIYIIIFYISLFFIWHYFLYIIILYISLFFIYYYFLYVIIFYISLFFIWHYFLYIIILYTSFRLTCFAVLAIGFSRAFTEVAIDVIYTKSIIQTRCWGAFIHDVYQTMINKKGVNHCNKLGYIMDTFSNWEANVLL